MLGLLPAEAFEPGLRLLRRLPAHDGAGARGAKALQQAQSRCAGPGGSQTPTCASSRNLALLSYFDLK